MKPFESAYPTQTQWSPRQEKWQGVLTRETDVSDAETADLLTSYLVIYHLFSFRVRTTPVHVSLSSAPCNRGAKASSLVAFFSFLFFLKSAVRLRICM